MKMKIRKSGIFLALSAVLLITALLVASCFDPIGKLNLAEQVDEILIPSEGKTFVKLGFDAAARTILPTAPAVAAMYYSLTWTSTHGDEPVDETRISHGDLLALRYELELGNLYELTVDAFRDNTTGLVVASADVDFTPAIAAAVAGVQTIEVILEPTTETGNGTFSWSLGIPTNATTATLGIYSNPDLTTGQQGGIETLAVGTANGSRNLPTGVYYVRVYLAGAATLQAVTVSEVLHVYQGLESSYAFTFQPLNNMEHAITLNYNNAATPNTRTITPVLHGGTIAARPDIGRVGASTVHGEMTRPGEGYTIVDWRTASTAIGVATGAWTWGAPGIGQEIWRPRTFFAHWDQTHQVIGITVVFDLEGQSGIIVNGGTPVVVNIDDLDDNINTIINLSGATIQANSIIWSINDNEIIPQNDTLTLGRTHLELLQCGTANITARFIITDSIYNPHSHVFPITVVCDDCDD